MEYRILIVDENPARRRHHAEALIAAAPAPGLSYKITTTGSVAAAQLQATRQRYHLLITALRAGDEGLALAQRLHALHASLQLLLIHDGSASPESLRAAAKIGARLIDHQASPDDLRVAVSMLLGLHRVAPKQVDLPAASSRPPATMADLQLLIDVLRRQARAQLALYLDNLGNIITQHGDPTGLDLPALTSLNAGSFVNSLEMGRLLRDPATSHLIVHEGAHFDIYATNVGSSRILTLIFDKSLSQPKLGMIWLLLKRAAEQLGRMQIVEKSIDEMLSDKLSESLNLEFDRLFGDELERNA